MGFFERTWNYTWRKAEAFPIVWSQRLPSSSAHWCFKTCQYQSKKTKKACQDKFMKWDGVISVLLQGKQDQRNEWLSQSLTAKLVTEPKLALRSPKSLFMVLYTRPQSWGWEEKMDVTHPIMGTLSVLLIFSLRVEWIILGKEHLNILMLTNAQIFNYSSNPAQRSICLSWRKG